MPQTQTFTLTIHFSLCDDDCDPMFTTRVRITFSGTPEVPPSGYGPHHDPGIAADFAPISAEPIGLPPLSPFTALKPEDWLLLARQWAKNNTRAIQWAAERELSR